MSFNYRIDITRCCSQYYTVNTVWIHFTIFTI